MTDVRRIVSENRRTIWILAAALVVNAALYALVVSPLSERVQTEEQQAADTTRSLNAAQRMFSTAEGTVSGKQRAEDELQQFYKEVLPPDLSGARRAFSHLDHLAEMSDVRRISSRTPPEPERTGELRKLTRTLVLSGEYANIRQFIHELETIPEFLVLESITVMQSAEGRELNVTARVATYYRAGTDGN